MSGQPNMEQFSLQINTPAALHHLHITSSHPQALADFYCKQFNLLAEPVDAAGRHVLRGGARSFIISEGEPAALACSGFAIRTADELAALRKHVELSGAPRKIDDFVDLMRPVGLVEVSRTGIAAISRGPEPI